MKNKSKLKLFAYILGGVILAAGAALGVCTLIAGYTLSEFEVRTRSKDLD